MKFNDYQKFTASVAKYPNLGKNFVYPTLGLSGESGEVAEKIKKVIRDHKGKMDMAMKQEIAKELGDVLWYISQLSAELGFKLADIAKMNKKKLLSRKKRGVLHGKGDNR